MQQHGSYQWYLPAVISDFDLRPAKFFAGFAFMIATRAFLHSPRLSTFNASSLQSAIRSLLDLSPLATTSPASGLATSTFVAPLS